jgi:hypothetical protein
MKKFLVVDSDCLDVVERLRGIDKDYFLVLNLDKNKFELHCSSQYPQTYCLTFPYEVIDERMVDMALKTRVERSDEIFKELEREEEKRKKEIAATARRTLEESLYDC